MKPVHPGYGLILAIVLLLASCRLEPPERVSFPDDPRVLHGTWILQTTESEYDPEAVAGVLLAVLTLQAASDIEAPEVPVYSVSGHYEAADETLLVQGSVNGGTEHVYVRNRMAPQVTGGRPISVEIRTYAAEGEPTRHQLSLIAADSTEPVYYGLLSDNSAPGILTPVRLVRD